MTSKKPRKPRMSSTMGRPVEWKTELSSTRLPKNTIPIVREIAHALEDGLISEDELRKFLASRTKP